MIRSALSYAHQGSHNDSKPLRGTKIKRIIVVGALRRNIPPLRHCVDDTARASLEWHFSKSSRLRCVSVWQSVVASYLNRYFA